MSAIEGHLPEAFDGLSIMDRGSTEIYLISAWHGCVDDLVSITAGLGLVLPVVAGSVAVSAGTAMAIAPGKWLVESSAPAHFRLPIDIGAVTDLCHARTSLAVSGAIGPRLIQKLSPVDLQAEQYGPARVWQGGNAHSIGHTIYRIAHDDFIVYVERSYALDFIEGLQVEAMEFRAS